MKTPHNFPSPAWPLPEYVDLEVFRRYLDGVASPEECRFVRDWMNDDVTRYAAVDDLRMIWQRQSGQFGHEYDTAGAWHRLNSQLHILPNPVPKSVRRPIGQDGAPTTAASNGRRRRVLAGLPSSTPHRTWTHTFQLAALVVVVVFGAVWTMGRDHTQIISSQQTQEYEVRDYATTSGQRATISLRDGSRVTLAPGSRLHVPAQFGKQARDLTLEGEAYFLVQHDSARPFRVHTPSGVAEDLGTAFVVTAYPELAHTQVAVIEGAVSLYQPLVVPPEAPHETTSRAYRRASAHPIPNVVPSSGLTLLAGDVGRLDQHGVATLTRQVDVASYLAWMSGTLIFRGIPVREALPVLNRWYDLDLQLADSAIAAQHLVTTLGSQVSTSAMLQALALALDVKYTQSGRIVVLYTERSRTSRLQPTVAPFHLTP